MEKKTVTTMNFTAKEVCAKLGIEGELISFATPTRQSPSPETVEEKQLRIQIEVEL